MTGLIHWLRTVLRGTPTNQPEPPTFEEENNQRDVRKKASLFECPSCDTVYIAQELNQCSTCDVSVEDVDSVGTRSRNSIA